MRFFEQFQYKARNFLYEKDRERNYQKQSKSNQSYYEDSKFQEDNKMKKFLNSMDEIDIYLEEKVDEWNLKIKK